MRTKLNIIDSTHQTHIVGGVPQYLSAYVLQRPDTEEFVVRFLVNEGYQSEADYFTDDQDDAIGTAEHWTNSPRILLPEDKTVTLTTTLTDEFIDAIICTAVEGGSTYWAEFDGDYRGPKDWLLMVSDVEQDEAYEEWVNRAKMRDAVRTLLDPSKEVSVGSYTLNTLRMAAFNNDAGDVDAEVADVVLQFACFGKLIYG